MLRCSIQASHCETNVTRCGCFQGVQSSSTLCWMWQGRRRRAIASKVSSCATLVEKTNECMLPDNGTLCDICFRTLKLTTPTFGGTVDRKHHRCHCNCCDHVLYISRLHRLCDSKEQQGCLHYDVVWWWKFHSRWYIRFSLGQPHTVLATCRTTSWFMMSFVRMVIQLENCVRQVTTRWIVSIGLRRMPRTID